MTTMSPYTQQQIDGTRALAAYKEERDPARKAKLWAEFISTGCRRTQLLTESELQAHTAIQILEGMVAIANPFTVDNVTTVIEAAMEVGVEIDDIVPTVLEIVEELEGEEGEEDEDGEG